MKSKHILFLASWYPSRISPFNGDFVQRHARAVALKNQVSVLFIVKDDELETNYEIIENQNDVREIIVYYKGGNSILSKFRKFNAFFKGLKIIGKFDLVHLNVAHPAGIFALFLKWFKGEKYVLTEHWTVLHPNRFFEFGYFKRLQIKYILKNAEIILPVSSDLGKSILKITGGENFEVIPNVVDVQDFKPNEQKSNQRFVFLHLSMLSDAHKNISGMLRVAKRLAEEGIEFEFQIGGNGPLDWIDDYIFENKLEENIKTFGALSHEEVSVKMAQADCFVLFSNYENQPCVQIEAYASGIPFIGTDVGGISEFLPDNFGFLIPKADEQALYEAMLKAIKSKFATPDEMHQYAVDNFSKEVISEKYDEIYNQIISKK